MPILFKHLLDKTSICTAPTCDTFSALRTANMINFSGHCRTHTALTGYEGRVYGFVYLDRGIRCNDSFTS